MTQTTGPKNNEWGTPWATADPGDAPVDDPRAQAGFDPQPPASGAPRPGSTYPPPAPGFPPPGSGYGPPDGPPAGAYPPPAPGQQPAGRLAVPARQAMATQQLSAPPNLWSAPPPGGSGGFPTPQRREPRRPGWGAVVGIGAGAAVLSSLLTAGVVTFTNDRAAPVFAEAPQSASSGQVSPPVTGGSATSPNWGAVANAVEPSVVSVQVAGRTGNGEGSGIILDAKGHVLTNNHVAAGAGGGGSITVVLHDGRLYPATIVGTDASTDLAVLQIGKAPSNLKPATLGNSSAVKVGDQVMAAGNPLGLSDTVTTGIVSAINRPVTTSAAERNPFGGRQGGGEAVVTNAIQTDAAINHGNSGGPLLDRSGRVMGVSDQIESGGVNGNVGVGFAIPGNAVNAVVPQLLAAGKAQHAWLGVQVETIDSMIAGAVKGLPAHGVLVVAVVKGSPAAKAGLVAGHRHVTVNGVGAVVGGDAIVSVDGKRVSSAGQLADVIAADKPGETVSLGVVRNGHSKTVKVTLGNAPANPPSTG